MTPRDRDHLDVNAVQEFIAAHRLPAAYAEAIEEYFLPLARWLKEQRRDDGTFILGINGAQGTGKSTLGDFLALACRECFGWSSAVLSIDDFYLTRAERESLAATKHPLLRTRGVPGTHDTTLLSNCLDSLCELGPGDSCAVPRFDKSLDDRAQALESVVGPVDLLILEGWCVGTPAESPDTLVEPVNVMEREHDADRGWRTWVNEQLLDDYEAIWSRLDALVFLRAPSFDAIYAWRLEQEHKLADRVGRDAEGVMSDAEVRDFINNFERLTRLNLSALTDIADVIFDLDESHAVAGVAYR